MMKICENYHYIILGAGIIGLSIARALKVKEPHCRILIVEKEHEAGLHGSGRNSGVLHSGIYYPSDTIKAQVCAVGARLMADYCQRHGLPINKMGKVIVPLKAEDDPQIEILHNRARANGARVEIISRAELEQVEPEARSASGRALYSPDTAVVDPGAILKQLVKDLKKQDVELLFSTPGYEISADESVLTVSGKACHYDTLYNATGLYADKVAKQFRAGLNYDILPFKGQYYKCSEHAGISFNGLIYPVPDLNVPFLGIHTVKSVDGSIYFGPTAFPALGRENYSGLDGVSLLESGDIVKQLLKQYWYNHQGFRNYAHAEGLKIFKRHFTRSLRKMVPSIKPEHLLPSNKVGIRAQLLNTSTNKLEMDFIVEQRDNTFHVLNAVSPAFTGAFEFSRLLVNRQLDLIQV